LDRTGGKQAVLRQGTWLLWNKRQRDVRLCSRGSPNSLLVISDRDGWTPPRFEPGVLILASSSCITVGCRIFADGETLVSLGPATELDPGEPPALDGMLATPNRAVVVSTVERHTVLQTSVPDTRTRVRIWVDEPVEPEKVMVGVG
jgi:hypothetical protein